MTGLFQLNRKEDVSGVSGTGIVAHGMVAPNGKVALIWSAPTRPSSTVMYDSLEDMIAIHGHDGATAVEWVWSDDPEAQITPRDLPATPEAQPERKAYRPPLSVESSFFTDRHEMHALLEHAFRALRDAGTPWGWVWMGAPTNNLKDLSNDRGPNILPESVILRDIAFQRYAIKNGLQRATSLDAARSFFGISDPTPEQVALFASYDEIRALNGPVFEDFGSLLTDHDHSKRFGNRIERLMVKDTNTCFAFGLCDEAQAQMHMNRRSLEKDNQVRMSQGFLSVTLPEEGGIREAAAIHSYEDSALTTGVELPANPITFWYATKVEQFSDKELASFESGLAPG